MSIQQRIADRFIKAALPRELWLPDGGKDIKPITPDGTDLTVYQYDKPLAKSEKIGYFLVIYQGKQSKPFVNYYYRSEGERARTLEGYVKGSRERLERKQKSRDDAKQFKTSLFYGDILYTSWGYDQTNVDFYEVIEVLGDKMIKVREVASDVVDGDGMYQNVVAVPGKYVGPEMKVKVTQGDNAKIDGHYAHKWDGKPKHETGPYGGH